MKLLELFEEIEEKKSSKGTFVGVRFGPKTVKALVNWMDENKIKNPTSPENLHTTVILDKNKEFDWDEEDYESSLKVNPNTFHLEKFGENNDILVLAFNSRELTDRHNKGIIEHDIDWDFPDYTPHVTLSENAKNIKLDKIELPKFFLYISHEYVTPFDDDYEINESVGIIVNGVNTTDDVKEGETKRQAKKFGNTIGEDGQPPSYWESSKLAAKEIK